MTGGLTNTKPDVLTLVLTNVVFQLQFFLTFWHMILTDILTDCLTTVLKDILNDDMSDVFMECLPYILSEIQTSNLNDFFIQLTDIITVIRTLFKEFHKRHSIAYLYIKTNRMKKPIPLNWKWKLSKTLDYYQNLYHEKYVHQSIFCF